jgi:hypothetical protein
MCGINVSHFTNQKKEAATRPDEKVVKASEAVKPIKTNSNELNQSMLIEKKEVKQKKEEEVAV